MTKRITVCGAVAPGQKDVTCRLNPNHRDQNMMYHVALVGRAGDPPESPRLMWWMTEVPPQDVKVSEPIDLDAPGEPIVYGGV